MAKVALRSSSYSFEVSKVGFDFSGDPCTKINVERSFLTQYLRYLGPKVYIRCERSFEKGLTPRANAESRFLYLISRGTLLE